MQKHMRRLSRKSLRLSAVCRNFGSMNNKMVRHNIFIYCAIAVDAQILYLYNTCC